MHYLHHRAQVTSQIADLKKMLHVKDKLITELATTVEAQSKELSSASKEMNNLRIVVADINNQLSANTWKKYRNDTKAKPTLVVGSSLIRDISESQLDNTELTCISGGRIADAASEISQIPDSKYEHIVLVIGGNDCDPHDPLTKKPPADIVDQYRSLVQKCKQKAETVTASSICPRMSSEDIKSRIDAVNAGIQVLCDEENVNFVDNNPCFHLKDDSINDAYILSDGIHLTYRGTNKLAHNLKLMLKKGQNNFCNGSSKNRVQWNTKAKPKQEEISEQSVGFSTNKTDMENEKIDLQHPFWTNTYSKLRQTKPQTFRKNQQTRNWYSSMYETSERKNNSSMPDDKRCFFCYESNHTVKTCRHEKPLMCNTCGVEGHKSKHH